ncbi:F pilus assembly protein traE (plasmid) [Candidatus Megaera polyxenophila]|jgi:conjugal transfer pilus assembly protein TraE|nr:F pilus assembly protein traE [Candidatus Megaera polyxenophila]
MEKQVMVKNIDQVARQRNFLLLLVIVSVFSVAALSLKLITTEAKVILAPGLNQEVWTSDKGVSISYLEETSAMYMPLLLDLTSDSIDWKKELLMNHVSQSDAKYMRLINEYFAASKEKYKRFSLSTHFAVKSFEVNQKELTVKAIGQLNSRFGERGVQNIPAVYGLSFEWRAGKLLLKEFVKLSKEEEELYDHEQN